LPDSHTQYTCTYHGVYRNSSISKYGSRCYVSRSADAFVFGHSHCRFQGLSFSICDASCIDDSRKFRSVQFSLSFYSSPLHSHKFFFFRCKTFHESGLVGSIIFAFSDLIRSPVPQSFLLCLSCVLIMYVCLSVCVCC